MIGAAVAAGRYICELDRAKAAARDAAIRHQASNRRGETAADLIPAISTGVILPGSAAAGERFIQPVLDDGRKLDDLTGDGWRLFVRDGATGFAANGVAQFGAGELTDNGAVAAWLDLNGAKAVLVRPDHYVFGTGASDTLIAARARSLGLALERAA